MKKTLALILALSLVLGAMSGIAFAAEVVVTDEAGLLAAVANDGEITLGGNITLSQTVVIPENVTVVLDLKGYAITMEDSIKTATYAFNNLGNLTIKNTVGSGSVSSRGIYNGYGNGADNVEDAVITILSGTYNALGTNGGAAIFNYGKANINGGSFTSIGGYSLNCQAGASMTIAAGVTANNGIYASNATLVINGGEIKGNRSGCHVVYAWNSDVTINGGDLYNNNSGNATVMCAGTTKAVINGGTFGIKDGRVPGNGNTWTSCLTDTANSASLVVNGGTFNGGFRVQAGTTSTINGGIFNDSTGSNYNINGTVVVNGGTFEDATATSFATKYLSEESTTVVNPDGTITAGGKVAKINDTYYPSIDSAIAAAATGDTIDLLGNTIEIAKNPGLETKKLTFKNGTMDFTNASSGDAFIWMSGDRSITFEDMTLLIKDKPEGATMLYWMDMKSKNATASFINCKIDFDAVQASYISGNEPGYVYFKDCEIEAEQANFVYRASATFENCTFDGYADLDEGESAGNIIQWAAAPCVIKNSTVNTRNLTCISANGTIAIVDGSFVQAASVYSYYAAGDANYTAGLITVDATSTLEANEIDMGLINDASAGKITSEASSIYVQYKKTDLDANGVDNLEGADTYELVLVGANNAAMEEIINELASADLTFEFVGTPVTGGAMDYTVAPATGVTLTQLGDRFMFNYDGATKYEESGSAIVIGTIRIDGYGTYTFGTKSVETNAVYATEIRDNIVDGYSPAAGLVTDRDFKDDDGMVEKIAGAEIKVPTRTLTVNIAFPNAVVDKVAAYQDMKVEITGNIDGVNKTETYDLGENMTADGKYVVTESRLVLNNAYTVTVSGAGYRTARYTVTMTGNKELNFWNNVMDEKKAVEPGKASSEVTKNFLAGDIVKDNQINIYDLSAVVSYFATTTDITAKSDYAKYDLNRDGVIDSKDVAYVLVSWGE